MGLSALFGLQALINMAVVLAVMPAKGITLPFVSYGGSSLLVSMASIGVLLSISRRPEPWAISDMRGRGRRRGSAADRGKGAPTERAAKRGAKAKPKEQDRLDLRGKRPNMRRPQDA